MDRSKQSEREPQALSAGSATAVPDGTGDLAAAIRGGSERALSRGLSWIEAGGARARALSEALYPYTKSAHVVGITGAPGAGKSTLVTALIKEARKLGKKIGVLAVDPTSPFTGGAILGDRIRMTEFSGDSDVFIRSMATRGALGGLASAAADAIDLLCAAGKEIVFVETVGVGQDEIEIMRVAHTTVVVSVPGLGDDIQALKAGIVEIADIHVVNKADREGAERTIHELRTLLAMTAPEERAWQAPIVPCVATRGDGAAELLDKIGGHMKYLRESGELGKRLHRMAESRVLKIAQAMVAETLQGSSEEAGRSISGQIQRVAEREMGPYQCAEMLLERAQAAKGWTGER